MFASQHHNPIAHKARLVALLTSTALVTFGVFCNPAFAQSLPTGGQVAAGSATIGAPANGAMTINQASQNAIVNWQSFNIGQGNSVTFAQPSASSVILNRVTGSTSTTIAGQLNANGQVYLVNPNGIAITSTGTVNTGAFVASTLGISDSDFMAGKRSFIGNGASSAVTNAGRITISRGGYLALIGGTVDNSGSITVPMGKAALGSGEQATLDLAGDGFLQVAIPTKAGGNQALVSNRGKISANGGTVQLTAAAARDMARQAVNMSGTIEARSVGGKSGDIILGGDQGVVAVSGKLSVASSKAKGGNITVTGRDIRLTGARLDASGKTGGGAIKIGGDRQGQGTLQRAETATIDSATSIKADATSTGNGGNVVVWSDSLTTFAGTISAKGGVLSGNGGEAEVSGKALLNYTGFTNLSAFYGAFGNLLLDPYNVTISNGADTGGFTASGNDSVINVNTLQAALGSANVAISTGSGGSQAGNITVDAPVAWSAPTTLTLNAANIIAVNAGITFGGGAGAGLTLNAANALAINAPITVNGAGAVALVYNAASTANLSFGLADNGFAGSLTYRDASGNALSASPGNQSLTINGNAYTLIYAMSDLDAIDGTSAVTGAGVTAYGTGLAGRYALAANLNAAGTTYTTGLIAGGNTTATAPTAFSGTFEGLGHTISNLAISNGGNNYVGLIGNATGTVRDISISGGSVAGAGYVGGLVGNSAGTITQSSAGVSVSATNYVGGLVGYSDTTGKINNAYATGAVSTGANSNVGGLVGYNKGAITYAYATGTVSTGANGTGSMAGGLVGYSDTGSTISQAYATGSLTGTRGDSYGGLVGYNRGVITQTYATGALLVTLANYVGGVIGSNVNGNITSSYWDTQTSGESAIGVNRQINSTNITFGRTTAQLQNLSSYGSIYAGWDFANVWSPPNQTGQNNNSAIAYYPQLYALSRVIAVAPSAATTVYGNGAPALSAQYYGLRTGDSITTQAGFASILTTTPVGTYAATASGASATNPAYRFVYFPAQVTVTPRPISLSGSRIYDGSTGLDASIFTIGNLVGGQTLTLSGTGSMTDKTAGNGKSVSLGSLVLGNGSGGLASNYMLSGGSYTVDITKATLTLTGIAANDKTYDGTTVVTIGNVGSLSGVVSTDAVSFSSGGASFADKNAGTGKTVNISGLTLSGTDAGNYTLASTTATTTANIGKATISAITGVTAANKTYDGSTTATLSTSGASFGGMVANDVLTVGSAVGAFTDKNAANGKTVNISGLTLSGADAGNYTLSSSTAMATADIGQRIVNLSGSRTYDGSTDLAASIFNVSNLVTGESLTLSGTGSMADKNAGAGKAVALGTLALGNGIGGLASNYTLSGGTDTADIARATISSITGITAGNKTYDGTTSAALSTSGASFGGIVMGDSLSVGTATGAFADKNAASGKTVNITGLTLSGTDAGNYTLASTSTATTADIGKATISSIAGITASNKTYDGSTTATLSTSGASFGGMVANDVLTVGSATGAFADKNAATGKNGQHHRPDAVGNGRW